MARLMDYIWDVLGYLFAVLVVVATPFVIMWALDVWTVIDAVYDVRHWLATAVLLLTVFFLVTPPTD